MTARPSVTSSAEVVGFCCAILLFAGSSPPPVVLLGGSHRSFSNAYMNDVFFFKLRSSKGCGIHSLAHVCFFLNGDSVGHIWAEILSIACFRQLVEIFQNNEKSVRTLKPFWRQLGRSQKGSEWDPDPRVHR